jgi:BASS family bile acid:Na+ symporter
MLRFLRFLGGRGTWVLFAGVFVGLGLPDLAALAHPLLTPCVVLLLLLAFLRVNWHEALSYARRPTLSLLVISWILLACPFLVWLVLKATALPEPLVTGLVLMAAAPPILGSTALAIMLRLDAALSVFSCLLATLFAPLTIPILALALLDLELEIGLWGLMFRLLVLVFGTLVAAIVLRRLVGIPRLTRLATEIDGLMVLSMLVFAIAIMDGVTAALLQRPGVIALWVAAAFVANPALQILGALAFAWLGRRQALTLGLASGNRNMLLILATLPAGVDFGVILFIAVAQLPMYTLPALQRPLYSRILKTP